MIQWGPQAKQGAVAFSFDNMGEASALEYGRWPPGEPVGFHRSIYETLPFLLDAMKEFGLKATFFLEAWNVEHYPDAVRAIAQAGHEIGSHGYRHETWFLLDDAQQVQTLQKAHDLFTGLGVPCVGFRPPGGISLARSEAFLKQLGYRYVSPVGGSAGMRSGLAVIPSEMHGTDVTYYSPAFASLRHPAAKGVDEPDTFADGFRLMLDDIARAGDCRSPVCHVTTVLDTQKRRDTFRRLVEMCVNDQRLWVATLSEVADWIHAHPQNFHGEERLRSFEPDWDPRTYVVAGGQSTYRPNVQTAG